MKQSTLTGEALRRQVQVLFQVIPDRSRDNELVFICPLCDDQTGNRSVNLSSGLTNCWKCGNGGRFLNWAKRHGHELDLSAVTELPEDFAGHIKCILAGRTHSRRSSVASITLPKGFTPLDPTVPGFDGCASPVRYRLIAEMAERKNLAIEDFIEAGVGYTTVGKWEPYAIFPVYNRNWLVYYQGRAYGDDDPDVRKKLFPSKEEVPLGASGCVYNLDELREGHVRLAIVLESTLNVLSVRKKLRSLGIIEAVPVCVFGHHISDFQARLISKCSHLEEICIFFDHDATEQAWEQAEELSLGCFRRFKVSVAEMPTVNGSETSDPNDDVDAAWAALCKREVIGASFAREIQRRLNTSSKWI